MNMTKATSVTQFLKKQNNIMEEVKSSEALTSRGHRSFISGNSLIERTRMLIEDEETITSNIIMNTKLDKFDAEKQHLPSYVALYAKDIFEYLKNTEVNDNAK
jgi:hypothetical protein